MVDADRKREFNGAVGFIYAWSGNRKAGEGEKEIKAIEEGTKIEIEIRFIKPFTATGNSYLVTESIFGN